MNLAQPLHGGGYDLHIGHARILPDPQRICSWEWVRHQLYTINWTNIALIITVLAVSTNIQAQLQLQQDSNVRTRDQIANLQQLLAEANVQVERLHADAETARSFNVTLRAAIDMGFLNVTGDLVRLNQSVQLLSMRSWLRAELSATTATHMVSTLRLIDRDGTAIHVAPSNYSVIITEAGTYLLGLESNQISIATGITGFVNGNSSSITPGAAEEQWSTICEWSAGGGWRLATWQVQSTQVTDGGGASVPSVPAVVGSTTTMATVTAAQLPLYVQVCMDTPMSVDTSPRAFWMFKISL